MQNQSLVVNVGYSQYTLEWADWDPNAPHFKGGNGLVWVTDGRIVIVTGLDNGDVPIQFTTTDTAPPQDLEPWDDVVEVSATISGTSVSVFVPDGVHIGDIDLPIDPSGEHSYRLRVHVRGRDRGREVFSVDTDAGDEAVEDHQILIWPAARAPEIRWKLTDQVGAEIRG